MCNKLNKRDAQICQNFTEFISSHTVCVCVWEGVCGGGVFLFVCGITPLIANIIYFFLHL